MTLDTQLYDLAAAVGQALRTRGLVLSTAESCTGGWVSEAVTMVSGSSDWFDRGFVTYTNAAKTELVGVPEALLASVGAVSEEVARAMAAGGLDRSKADIAVAVTGIAGPGGATPAKPVGLVHIAAARRDGAADHERHVFAGDRDAVRRASVLAALAMIERLAR
jgi:nicotinamide-nucleotide amidase